jgi:hypothetical protein
MEDSWKKASTSAPAWEPEEAKEIVGVLTEIKEDVGKFGSTLASLETKDGPMGVWCNSVLKDLMKKVPVGSEVKVTYLGKVAAKSGTGEYKSYEVNYRPAPMKKVEEIGF